MEMDVLGNSQKNSNLFPKKFLERLSPPKVSKEQAMSDVPESGPSGDMGV